MFSLNFTANFNIQFTKISHQLMAAAFLCILAGVVIFYSITKAYEVGDNLQGSSQIDLAEYDL